MKKISVIVPVYNGERYLEGCVSCLKRQGVDAADMEILLINDGSKDGSLETARRLAQGAQNIQVFDKPNGGLSDTRNYGMERASGTYIYFLDVDDLLADGALKALLETAEEEKAEIVTFNSLNVRDGLDAQVYLEHLTPDVILPGNYRTRSVSPKTVYAGREFVIRSLNSKEGFFPPVWLSLYEKEFLIRNQLWFEKIIHEDCVFSIDAQLSAKRIVYLDLDAHLRRIVADSITNGKKSEKHVLGCWRASDHAKELYEAAGADPELRGALTGWCELNAWNIYTELGACDKEIKRKYKWKYARYALSCPVPGKRKMFLKAAVL